MKCLPLSLAGLVIGLVMLAATPAAAQRLSSGVPEGPGSSGTEVLGNPSEAGIVATTPSRIRASRREMNRGRGTPFEVGMSRRETRRFASDLLERADLDCTVADALVVARTTDNIPAVEINCREGGGIIMIDTVPIQATDCLDFPPVVGEPARGRSGILACQLPANVAAVDAARQSAMN